MSRSATDLCDVLQCATVYVPLHTGLVVGRDFSHVDLRGERGHCGDRDNNI